MAVTAISSFLRSSVRRPRLLVLLCLGSLVASAQAPETPVFVQETQRKTFTETLEALGTLRANESVTLSATVTETISAIYFEDGQRVKKGDVLVEMTNAEELAELVEAQSTLEEAERQYRRVESLSQSNVATESLLDERRRAFRIAQARLQGVQSRLQDLRLVAPFDGVVGLRNVSVGTLVRPGDVITTLDDDTIMKLDITVPSVHLDVLRPGLAINARARALQGRVFNGEIASIASRIDPVTRSVVVRALIPNPDRILRPGLLMRVQLDKQPRESLLVAEEAVVQRSRRSYVFVVDQSTSPPRAMEREVTLGGRRPGEVEILEGLEEGELVVIHGTHKIRPGSEVRIAAVAEGGEDLQELLRRSQEATNANSAGH